MFGPSSDSDELTSNTLVSDMLFAVNTPCVFAKEIVVKNVTIKVLVFADTLVR